MVINIFTKYYGLLPVKNYGNIIGTKCTDFLGLYGWDWKPVVADPDLAGLPTNVPGMYYEYAIT